MAADTVYRVVGDVIGAAGGSSWDVSDDTGLLQRSTVPNIFTLRLREVAAGSYQFKIAVNGSWDESYGQDGSSDPGAPNMTVNLDTIGDILFYYEANAHRTRVEVFAKAEPRTSEQQMIVDTPQRMPGLRTSTPHQPSPGMLQDVSLQSVVSEPPTPIVAPQRMDRTQEVVTVKEKDEIKSGEPSTATTCTGTVLEMFKKALKCCSC
eukprot:m.496093 g.496093  ORF g.496093 m.496093 type:complete len:207 (+) comp46526_c0_seq1:304-924(+)